MRALAAVLVFALLGAAPPSMQIGGWDLRTEDVVTNIQTGSFTLPNHVNLVRADGSTIDADRATGNFKQRSIDLSGHVVMHDNSGAMGAQIGVAAKSKRNEPATITSDTMHIDETQRLYVATGSVKYVQGTSTMNADRVEVDNGRHKVHLSGHVRVAQ